MMIRMRSKKNDTNETEMKKIIFIPKIIEKFVFFDHFLTTPPSIL